MNKGKFLLVICSLGLLLSNSSMVYASPTSQRLAGHDRYETAIQVSKAGFTNKSEYIVLASGENFPDALCAAPLAKKFNSPVLLNTKSDLLSSVKQEITRLGANKVIIIGGPGSISGNVEAELNTMNIKCTRIYGKDRYETSVKVAEQLDSSTDIAVASGLNYPDAISISSIAAEDGMPILLTEKDYLPKCVEDYLKSKNVKTSYLIGGKGVVSDNVANSLKNVKRLSGNNRYDTNIAVINNFTSELNFNSIYVTSGENYPDAIAASVLAAKTKSPVCLINDASVDKLKTIIAPKIQSSTNIKAIGETDVVSNDVVAELLQNTGNSNSNLKSVVQMPIRFDYGGFVAKQGAWNYYYLEGSGYFYPGSLYKIKDNDTKSILLAGEGSQETKSNINVVGEFLYYEKISHTMGPEDEISYTNGIYKMKTDGTGEIKITSDNAREIIVVGNSIYYCNDSDNGNLYKIGVDGTGKAKITDDNAYKISYSDDYIYYLLYKDGGTTNLYKIKVDGSNKTVMQSSENIINMIVDGDYIYYLTPTTGSGSATNSIYKMNSDGTQKTKICDVSSQINSFNVLDGNIYYLNFHNVTDAYGRLMSVCSSLAKISSSGVTSNISIGNVEGAECTWITNNMIYLYGEGSDGYLSLYRMNMDGSNLKMVNRFKKY